MIFNLILLCIFANVMSIKSYPEQEHHHSKGRSWEYGTKIEHPAGHKHWDHKDAGKGWTHTSDTGDTHHKGWEEPVKHEIHEPVHFPKYDTDLDHEPKYEPKFEFPKYEHKKIDVHHIHHYEPKKPEPKKEEHKFDKFDSFADIGGKDININVDGIIDDIQNNLKKTSEY